MVRSFRTFFILTLIALLGFNQASFAVAQTTTSIDIGMTIPGTAGGGGGGGGGNSDPLPETDNSPSIGSVVATPGSVSAQITWTASDDKGISGVTLEYGTTESYGSNGTVSGAYLANLAGLSASTQYFFRIRVTDSIGQVASYTGSFTTSAAADTTAPNVSGIVATTNVTTATIRWVLSETGTSEVAYGLTTSYGQNSSSESGSATNHLTTLSGLVANTTYHFRISATDSSGNSTTSIDAVFTTLADTVAPANPTNVSAVTSTSDITLAWTNPPDGDFTSITIVRKTGSAPTAIGDGTSVYVGSGQTFVDATVSSGVLYYYTLFASDSSGNVSGGVSVNGRVTAPVVNEICNNNIDDNSNGQTDCSDSACTASAICQPQIEICTNSIDDDSDGLIDCADSTCTGASVCAVTTEICTNSIDDNNNGQTDCADVACFGVLACQKDDDGYVPPTSTVPGGARLNIGDLLFWGDGRRVALQVNNGVVTSLAAHTVSVGLRKSSLVDTTPISVILKNDSASYRMVYDSGSEAYYTDIVFPPVGRHSVGVEVNYGAGQVDVIPFVFESLPFGIVQSGGRLVKEATVTPTTESGQVVAVAGNPHTTTVNGSYGWVVQNGRYILRVTGEDYYPRVTTVFQVSNNVVNQTLELVERPPDLLDDISTTSTLAENATAIAKNLGKQAGAVAELGVQRAKDAAQAVRVIKNDPAVQQAASQVVAPTAVGIFALSTFTVVSWSSILPFLRFLFLQPLMLLGLRRRAKWGQVYNTLTKLPIDLATIRLFDAEKNRVLQAKVTDKEGRYAFVVNPGKYRMEVIKNGFAFPSVLLAGVKSDGRRPDIYHGEIIEVSEQGAVITASIPLDPAGEYKKPTRLIFQKIGRVFQAALSWLGLIVTLASLYISPRWYVWVLAVVHILFFFMFRRLAVPPKVKSWGIVYDAATKKPIGRAVARLFNSEFNKLVSTQVTDGSGRYYFLASDDKYYVTYDHPEYKQEKTGVLDLTGQKTDHIAVDIGLVKGQDEPRAPLAPSAPVVTPAPEVPPPATNQKLPEAPPSAPVVSETASAVATPIDLNNPPEPTPEAVVSHIDLANPPEPSAPNSLPHIDLANPPEPGEEKKAP